MTRRGEIDTEALVGALADCAAPVNRLSSPHARMAKWFMLSLMFAATVVVVMGLRPDIASKLGDTRFLIEVGAAVMTSMLAAGAAFCAGCPGRPIWERFAPLPAVAVWLGSLAYGCWESFIARGTGALALTIDLMCLPYILMVASVPMLLILAMIRRGAPIAPKSATMLAILASTSLGAAALRLFHTEDDCLMVLVWQFGSVALLASAGALLGRSFLRWPQEVR